MPKHLTEIKIDSFKGITDFEIKDLGSINILLGDNNCGKTSFLEAIEILNRPNDFNNIVMISRRRERFRIIPRGTQSLFGSFINLFNKTREYSYLSLSCVYNGCSINLNLKGEVKKTILTIEEIEKARGFSNHNTPFDEETEIFSGSLTVVSELDLTDNEISGEIMINFSKHNRVIRSVKTNGIFNVSFLSPIDHIVSEKSRVVTRNREITKNVIEILKTSFDNSISDLRIMEDEHGYTYLAVEHEKFGYESLAIYGDGVKKVLAIAGAAAEIKDGILLIDEYETSLHPDAMKTVFRFLIDVCKKRNIQLFLTTHSLEAVDKILDCNNDGLEDMRIIKLTRKDDKTSARVLNGVKAEDLRFYNNAELR